MQSKTQLRTAAVNYHNSDLFIKSFIDYVPKRLDFAVELNLSEEWQEHANTIDYIDFHYRLFLSGGHKTLARVNMEVRRALIKGTPEYLITNCVNDLEAFMIKYEFYELIPKLQNSHIKINKIMSQERKRTIAPF